MRYVCGGAGWLGIALVWMVCATPAAAQIGGQPRPPAAAQPPGPGGLRPDDFPRLMAEFEGGAKRYNEIPGEYKAATDLKAKSALEDEYKKLQQKLPTLRDQLAAAAEVAYAADPKKFEQAAEVLIAVADANLQEGDFQGAKRIIDLLIRQKFPDPAILNLAAAAAIELGDLNMAEKYLLEAKQKMAIIPLCENYLKEIQARRQDAQANDLPQIVFHTSKGDIFIELFENEAPNTVANIVSLVEKGYYNGLTFHRVLDNFMAQGGDPKGDGTGGPGYHVPCECEAPNHRVHFRGSLSMAHAGKDTGGSQFFLCFRATPHLDGKHTVFGRVVKGYEVLDNLQRVDPNQPDPAVKPDRIVKAEVIRKRNHPYVPKTIATEEVPPK